MNLLISRPGVGFGRRELATVDLGVNPLYLCRDRVQLDRLSEIEGTLHHQLWSSGPEGAKWFRIILSTVFVQQPRGVCRRNTEIERNANSAFL
jgi:hypothetical protein